MKESWEKECADLREQLAALQQQLQALQTVQASSPGSTRNQLRWRLSRRVMVALMPVVALVAVGSALYGQGAVQALFIDKAGNVGIGTTEPSQRLHVAGGNGLINNVFLGDVGHGQEWAGFSNSSSKSTTGYALLQNSTGTETYINKKSGNGHIGFRIDNADKMVVANDGNVGIGTTDPKATLDVKGAVSATSVNGEKQPMVFELGQKGDTKNWHYVNKDIGPLCGDGDGCTMKFFLRQNSTGNVRTISELTYIGPPGPAEWGLRGWTRQLGGGESEFVLGTKNWYEIVPHPWDWIYVRNMFSKDVGGQEQRFSGYNVQFMTPPNISAKVIIYDR